MPKALAAGEQLLLVARCHALGCVDERLQVGEPGGDGVGVTRQLVVAAPRGEKLAPGQACLLSALGLLGAAERVEDVELKRRPRETALFELAGHRNEPFRSGRDVLARDSSSPRVRARAPVPEDPARDHEPRLPLGAQLRERGDLLVVEEPARQTSSSASTYASEPSVPTDDASARAPSRSPIACAKIVFPAPVSPVTAFRPDANDSSALRIRTRFSIRRLRSMRSDSSRQEAAVRSSGVRPAVRDLAIVLAVSWAARILFVVAIGDAHSNDVDHWRGVLLAQDQGRNPYELGVLNWPPLWLVVLVCIDFASNLAGIGFWTALRVYLVAVESVLIVVLYLTLVSLGPSREAVRRSLLVGIALNPVTIILVCQHGNSDVQVGLLVTLAIAALCAHWRTRDVVLWLCACLFIGLGVLAKTVPLVLAPILAPGARLASAVSKLLGIVLVVGPATMGLGVIAALVPIAVWDHVIRYRGTRGFFGLSGILEEFAGIGRPVQARIFTIAVLVVVAWLAYRLWREPPLPPGRLFLLTALILMTVVALGPGYGPQYAYWFVPVLVGTYVLLDDGWRRLLRIAWVVAAVTYAIEYAFVPFLGAWAIAVFGGSGWIADVSDHLSTPRGLLVFRLPLLAVYLIVIAEGVRRLARGHQEVRAAPP